MADIYQTFEFEHEGRRFKASLAYDDAHPPWEESSGHGPVSNWTSRDKKPGERQLCADRWYKRYYDFQEAMKRAKRDGWGLSEKKLAELEKELGRTPTKAEVRARAVEVDFEYLRGWCNDEWHWCGVGVQEVVEGQAVGDLWEHSLWRIESTEEDYIQEVARELASEIEPYVPEIPTLWSVSYGGRVVGLFHADTLAVEAVKDYCSDKNLQVEEFDIAQLPKLGRLENLSLPSCRS